MPVGQDLLNVPFPAMIRSMGLAIAEAQYELDLASMRIAQLMAGYDPVKEDATEREPDRLIALGPADDEKYTLLELGFTPTFYQFVDTLIEVKMSISMSQENTSQLSSTTVNASVKGSLGLFSASARMNVSTVSASFSSKYQYSAEGSSILRTKLVTVPTPPILEERLRERFAASEEE